MSTATGDRGKDLLDRRGLRWLRLHPLGLAWAAAFAALAMTPSLLPRSWLFQGVVSGVSAAVGYAAGAGTAWLLMRWARWRRLRALVEDRAPSWAGTVVWLLLIAAVVVVLSVVLVASAEWQQQTATLVGLTRPTTSDWLRAGPLMVAVAGLLIGLARGLRRLSHLVALFLRRWVRLPRRLASIAGALVVTALVVALVNDVVLTRGLSAADRAFLAVNLEDPDDVRRPTTPLRSGSARSLVPWESLGLQGRRFVSGGPTTEELTTAVRRGTPTAPIRVYAGLDSAEDPQARADLALEELRRTRAFERAVVLVVTTTGRGWVNENAARSLELLYGGDTAIVATQYSYLPSWLSFLLDRERSEEAGRQLVEAVSEAIDALPERDRPRLLVYGESLGSQGSEAAFTSLADIRAQTDGVLWVGPPSSNRMWRALVERRDPGTREVAPVYASGLVVRFADSPAEIRDVRTPWLEPRILYLQNPSDPIVWWNPELLFSRPDWLEEPRGRDVNPAMSWYPVVTFWQVSADMLHATDVPSGHGHNYGNLLLDAWVAVAAPEGWTARDTDRVRQVLRR